MEGFDRGFRAHGGPSIAPGLLVFLRLLATEHGSAMTPGLLAEIDGEQRMHEDAERLAVVAIAASTDR